MEDFAVEVRLKIGHTAQYRKEGGFTHDWKVYVRGPEECDISHFVEKVVFHLHESFQKPIRVVREPPYIVAESGYAGFELPIDVYFKQKDEPRKIKFWYDVCLQAEGGEPINVKRCEKLTFNNPTRKFGKKLLKAGGILLNFNGKVTDPSTMFSDNDDDDDDDAYNGEHDDNPEDTKFGGNQQLGQLDNCVLQNMKMENNVDMDDTNNPVPRAGGSPSIDVNALQVRKQEVAEAIAKLQGEILAEEVELEEKELLKLKQKKLEISERKKFSEENTCSNNVDINIPVMTAGGDPSVDVNVLQIRKQEIAEEKGKLEAEILAEEVELEEMELLKLKQKKLEISKRKRKLSEGNSNDDQ